MSVVQEEATACASCGGSIVQPVGRYSDFCSEVCRKQGRAFCKQCGDALVHRAKKGSRKMFCNNNCAARYYRVGAISPSALEEYKRSTCKGCDKSLTQTKTGKREFCSRPCRDKYNKISKRGLSLTEEWGSFAPETRKSIREVQFHMGIGAAQRLAAAITREYMLRGSKSNPRFVTYACKTCKKQFRRDSTKSSSKEYCSYTCQPKVPVPITWEEVGKIRDLYEKGHMVQSAIAKKYGVSCAVIGRIVRYEAWKPQHDPTTGGRKPVTIASNKVTWEQVDEIRRLYATGQMTQKALGEKYGLRELSIRNIVNYLAWKPENDPRRKEISV